MLTCMVVRTNMTVYSNASCRNTLELYPSLQIPAGPHSRAHIAACIHVWSLAVIINVRKV